MQGLGLDMLNATQNISSKYGYDMFILCVKIKKKTKSYSMGFKSKEVLSRVYDSYSLFRNAFQLKLVLFRNQSIDLQWVNWHQFLLQGVFEQILNAINFVGLIIIVHIL